jgi:wyosine [tRNA(Phe)-imidazoG37] synthetase (radical SAM superfamily)
LIREVKNLTDLPVAVITNGATLYQPDVCQALLAADAVLPSLDAGKPWLYRKINRPHPEITLDRLLGGLEVFSGAFHGNLWVEVMLVNGLNDTEIALTDIATALKAIRPDEIHINMPTRPPAETWVRPTDEDGLVRAQAILGEAARVVHPASGSFQVSASGDLQEAVVGIITRHPMREDELIRTLQNYAHQDVKQVLDGLAASGRAQVVERYGVRFWSGPQAVYPDNAHSQRTSPDSPRKSLKDRSH